jgi:pyruvate dehydrogenase E2 component (dihydrolipoamide acetyltransferase)
VASEIKVPIPDQVTEEVRILRWLKKVGDTVTQSEIILEIETEKSAIEVEASADGIVLELLANENDMVPVGKVVGFIGQAEEKPITTPIADEPVAATPVAVSAALVSQPGADQQVGQRKAISPNARRLGKELAVDIAQISAGTGKDGSIIGEDVKRFAALEQQKPIVAKQTEMSQIPQTGSMSPLSKMRRAIGGNLQHSWQQSPHFNVAMTINMARAMSFREQFNRNRVKPEQLSVNDLVVKASAVALGQNPAVNSRLADDKIVYHSDINIGIATAIPDGLVVPVLVGTDKLDWEQLHSQTKMLAKEARNGKIIGSGKGTFTISNLGMFGVDHFTAIINPPECAILAVGAVIDQIVAINKMIAIAPMMQVTLCSDHRLIDGATAAQFLKSLKDYLEEKLPL